MKQITDGNDLKGKRIKDIGDLADGLALVFDDNSFCLIEGSYDGGYFLQDNLIRACSANRFELRNLGLISDQECIDIGLAHEQMLKEQQEQIEKQEYLRLKEKFEV